MNDPMDKQPTETGACGELRLRSEAACADVPALRAAAIVAAESLARARATAYDAETRLAAAQDAADPGVIAEAKAQAQRAYRRTYASSTSTQDRRRAASTWLRELDRLNRAARTARSAFERARRVVASSQSTIDAAIRAADTERIRAETAADACRTARTRLAECEEREILSRPPALRTIPGGSLADEVPDDDPGRMRHPLVIQRLIAGDRRALRRLSAELAESTGRDATRFMLLLQELVEAITGSAAEAGFVEFADDDPFWAQFSHEDSRAIVQALAGMGFRFDAREGWLGGRQPGTAEFSLALAHVGYDIRGVRMAPGTGLADLFQGARVAVEEQLAQRAPHLALDQMLELLGPRGDGLGDLWDDWGRLRPLLLAESPD